jgi:hypothetical protein
MKTICLRRKPLYSNMQPSPTIEIPDKPPPWDPVKWLGKVYPAEDTPPDVLAAREQVLTCPPDLLARLPNDSLPVSQFLKVQFPSSNHQFLLLDPKACYSKVPPNASTDTLVEHPIPDAAAWEAMNKAFGQCWFNGSASITDPRHNDGHTMFPLYALKYWQLARLAVEKQRRWRKVMKWVNKQLRDAVNEETKALLQAAIERMEVLPWNITVPWIEGVCTTADLVDILSDEWLDDNHIDMMMDFIQTSLHLKRSLGVDIARLSFANKLIQCHEGRRFSADDYGVECRRLERDVKAGKLKQLYFPAHVNKNHWIGLTIDFQNHTIAYGA